MDRTIVVIEDEPLLRRQTMDILAAAGLKVVDFATGDEALAFIESHLDEPFAVFSDLKTMGDVDGMRIATAITEAHPGIIVVVTGNLTSEPPFEPGSRLRGIGKPWEAVDVLNAIIDAEQND